LRQQLSDAAQKVIKEYLLKNQQGFKHLEFSEKAIEIPLGDGVSIAGRIDLVRRLDTGEVTIVDLKSIDRAQSEAVTEKQLHIYALGYQELTGRQADYVEIYVFQNSGSTIGIYGNAADTLMSNCSFDYLGA
jgi:DNA helicase-2/ATP-dependent DNA helicase PcrA